MWPKKLAFGSFELRQMVIADIERLDHVARAEGAEPGWHPPHSFVLNVLERKSGFGIVVQRQERRGDAGPLFGFGVSAFIRPDCVERAREEAEAGEARRFIRELSDRDLLSESEIAQDNSGPGLSILVYGSRGDSLLDPAGQAECAALYTKGFLETHYGYNIQRLRFIVVSYGHLEYLKQAGAAVHGMERDPNRPWLANLDADVGKNANGTIFPVLFHTRQPLLRLSSPQREIALLALEGLTDAEAAIALSVTVDAVKKRWGSVFDTVSDRCPDLLPWPKDDGRRGPEKRSRFLDYLRAHVEELRPWI
jgi:hypothetical protein